MTDELLQGQVVLPADSIRSYQQVIDSADTTDRVHSQPASVISATSGPRGTL